MEIVIEKVELKFTFHFILDELDLFSIPLHFGS